MVYIFVDPRDYQQYAEDLKNTGYQIIKGQKGLIEQTNYISDYFQEGQKLVRMDDDIDEIYLVKDRKEMIPANLKEIIKEGFDHLAKTGFSMWGISGSNNPYFCPDTVSHRLSYLVGACYGFINDWHIRNTMEDHEDQERCILHFLKSGGLVKMKKYNLKTKYFYEQGGIQSNVSLDERIERGVMSAKSLEKRFPGMGKLFFRKNGYGDYRFNHHFRVSKIPENSRLKQYCQNVAGPDIGKAKDISKELNRKKLEVKKILF